MEAEDEIANIFEQDEESPRCKQMLKPIPRISFKPQQNSSAEYTPL